MTLTLLDMTVLERQIKISHQRQCVQKQQNLPF